MSADAYTEARMKAALVAAVRRSVGYWDWLYWHRLLGHSGPEKVFWERRACRVARAWASSRKPRRGNKRTW